MPQLRGNEPILGLEYAGETKGCRDCRGKEKVEAFGIWKILQSSGRKCMLNRRRKTVIESGRREDLDP
jgi:hypothetical protein